MTVLIKYPFQTKERNSIFFEKKDLELTNLDWAKWAGWYDTDGCFDFQAKTGKKRVVLPLKDRQPVELFSKTFEASLCYRTYKTITPEPYRYEYQAEVHASGLNGAKAVWFTKNVFPYLVRQEKKDYAARLLGYRPESKDLTTWTTDEVIYYLATAMEGDGFVRCSSRRGTTSLALETELKSSDVQYLSDVKSIADNKLGVRSTLSKRATYKTLKGIRTKYGLYILCSRKNPNNLGFFQNLVRDGVMTLDRKKQKIQTFVDYMS